MEIRKLESAEHGKTRFLWEKIFREDSQAFVDYYYFIRTRENTIYVVEEDGAIRAMLQKNPYRMKLEDSVFDSEYIVGVATEKEYRSRGYMRQLLIAALEEENKKSILLLFLCRQQKRFTARMIFDIYIIRNRWNWTLTFSLP